MPPRIKPLSVEWLINNEGRVMIDGFQIHFRIVEGGAMGFLWVIQVITGIRVEKTHGVIGLDAHLDMKEPIQSYNHNVFFPAKKP